MMSQNRDHITHCEFAIWLDGEGKRLSGLQINFLFGSKALAAPLTRGVAIAAMMPSITVTITSSTKLKPLTAIRRSERSCVVGIMVINLTRGEAIRALFHRSHC